ncbi:MAG TPA: protein YgfX [Usitatibacter sp.]|jgi:hypothetical protein|nr:protein YgfX [Usitatibacter sp.]
MKPEIKYSGALEATLGRSRRVRAFIAVACTATWALVAAMPLRLDASIVLATAMACLAVDAWRRSGDARRLVLDGDGAIAVDGRAGQLLDGGFVSPWFATIHWRPAGARFTRTLLVAPDMLPPDVFRELRVILRYQNRGQTTLSAFGK